MVVAMEEAAAAVERVVGKVVVTVEVLVEGRAAAMVVEA